MRTVAMTALAALLLPAPAAAAAPAATEVVSITVVPPQADTSAGGGFADLGVQVRLRNPDGLPAELTGTDVVHAVGGQLRPGAIDWPRLVNTGDTTDGVWSGTVRVAPGHVGTYTVSEVLGEPQPAGPRFTVLGDRWSIVTVRTPLRVVTGTEKWFPQARVTVATSGDPAGLARVQPGLDRAQMFEPPGTQADANGLWTAPVPVPLAGNGRTLGTYGSRGSRGWSLQGATCADLTVKLQASATYPASPIAAGTPLTVTGNVWPAPSIFAAEAGPLTLQRQTATGWTPVATTAPRLNGRYTLTWQPPGSGSYVLRVRWAGGGSPAQCRAHSVGTNLAATTVGVR